MPTYAAAPTNGTPPFRPSTSRDTPRRPTTLLTVHALQKFGLRSVPAGWFVQTRSPLTTAEINSARRTAAAAGLTVETRKKVASNAGLRNGATAVGLLVALGVLAMTVGLIRSETANELRTLAATGATSTTRRTITGATAGALALLGALLGTGGAYLALIAWHRSDLHPLTQVPYLDLVIIVVGLPLLAITAGWILAGREPVVDRAPATRVNRGAVPAAISASRCRGFRQWARLPASGLGVGGAMPRERVAIDVMEGLVAAGDLEHAFFFVRPRAVVVDGDVHAVAERAERLVEKRVRQDAVDLGADRRGDLELLRVGVRPAPPASST